MSEQAKDFADLWYFMWLCKLLEGDRSLSLRELSLLLDVSLTKIQLILDRLHLKFGAPLLIPADRKGGTCTITPLGQEVLDRTLSFHETLPHPRWGNSPQHRPSLILGSSPFLVESVLANTPPEWLDRPLEEASPNYRLHLREFERTQRAIQALRRGQVDLVLGWQAVPRDATEPPPDEEADRRIVFQEMKRYDTALIFHRNHRYFGKYVQSNNRTDTVPLADLHLDQELLFVLPEGSRQSELLATVPIPNRLEGGRRVAVSRGYAGVVARVRMNLGVGLVPALPWILDAYRLAGEVFFVSVGGIGQTALGTYQLDYHTRTNKRATARRPEQRQKAIDALATRLSDRITSLSNSPVWAQGQGKLPEFSLEECKKFGHLYFVSVQESEPLIPQWFAGEVKWDQPRPSNTTREATVTAKMTVLPAREKSYALTCAIPQAKLVCIRATQIAPAGKTDQATITLNQRLQIDSKSKDEVWGGIWCGYDGINRGTTAYCLLSTCELKLSKIQELGRQVFPFRLPNATLGLATRLATNSAD